MKKNLKLFSLFLKIFFLFWFHQTKRQKAAKAKQSKARCHFLSQLNTIDVSSISRKDKPRSWTKKDLNKKYLYMACCIEQVHLEKKVKFYFQLVHDDFFKYGPTLASFVLFFTGKLFTTMIFKLGIQQKHFRIYDKLCSLSRLISASQEAILSLSMMI